MSNWHADIDSADLGPGVQLRVLSPHQVVRVIKADTLSIETPTGARFSAMVLDREARELRFVLEDGRSIFLAVIDESLQSDADQSVFSQQTWLTH